MSRTRMWVMGTDRYGTTDSKFNVEDPLHIPRVGEFIDSNEVSGWVTHVQYNYRTGLAEQSEYSLVVNVLLGEKNGTHSSDR